MLTPDESADHDQKSGEARGLVFRSPVDEAGPLERLGPRRRRQDQGTTRQSISVAGVVLSHNYGHYLEACLDSVLAQSRPADEVLVVDDASTDDTRGVAIEFAQRGIRYLHVDCRNVHQARFSDQSGPEIRFYQGDVRNL